MPKSSSTARSALRFVIFMGIISLFAGFTYEGARSVNGQFLETLGASAAVVGFVAGFGELVYFSVGMQLVALPIFWVGHNSHVSHSKDALELPNKRYAQAEIDKKEREKKKDLS